MNLIDFNIIHLQILEENNFKEMLLECDCNQINLGNNETARDKC